MSKMEIAIAKTRQIADEIAWRHFWLAHVMTETGRMPSEENCPEPADQTPAPTPQTETEYRRWFQFRSIERRN